MIANKTYDIYGFLSVNRCLTNSPSTVNPVGEISIKARTYTKDILEYPVQLGTLLIFNVTKPITLNILDSDCNIVSSRLNELCARLDLVTTGTFSQRISTLNMPELTDIQFGDGVLNNINNVVYPSWISFINDGSKYLIWLSNYHFETEYPFIELNFISIISNMQELYTDFNKCQNLVSTQTVYTLPTIAKSLITHIITDEDYISVRVYKHDNVSLYFDLPILIKYNGNPNLATTALYMRALADKLVADGIFTLDQWINAIPTLVPINKFYIIPLWDNVAINNAALLAPICSPSVVVSRINNYVTKFLSKMEHNFIQDNLVLSTVLYKSIPFLAIQVKSNPDDTLKFSDLMPDYCLMHPADINIQQMSEDTQLFKTLLDKLIRYAESYNSSTILDTDTLIEVSGTHRYLIGRILNVEFAVLTRASSIL